MAAVAAFHHAHETYLVPDVLKRAYGTVHSICTIHQRLTHVFLGSTPAVAIFSEFQGYKREAYHSTHFAAKLLDEADIRVLMKVSREGCAELSIIHTYATRATIRPSSRATCCMKPNKPITSVCRPIARFHP